MYNIKRRMNNRKLYIAEINGMGICSLSDYYLEMSKAFHFPTKVDDGNGYLDWMRDLGWINAEEFILIIHDYAILLKKDANDKDYILQQFYDYIFPYWDKDVVKYSVGGVSKSFTVYLVE